MLRPFGLILAGGRSSRMGGGDKTLLHLESRTLVSRIAARVVPQCTGLAISANGDPGRFAPLPYAVIADTVDGLTGPLAGVLAGLSHIRDMGDPEWLLSVPGDVPFVPVDLVQRLEQATTSGSSPIVHARSGGRPHPLAALWHVSTLAPLRVAVEARGLRRVQAFQAEMHAIAVDWATDPIDPFFNINTPDDLVRAQNMLHRLADDPAR